MSMWRRWVVASAVVLVLWFAYSSYLIANLAAKPDHTAHASQPAAVIVVDPARLAAATGGAPNRTETEGDASSDAAGAELAPQDVPLAGLIAAWRKGGVDWHNLIVRAPASGNRELDDRRKEGATNALSDILSGYSTGAHRGWGANFGPMANYSACAVARDQCVIHWNRERCLKDSFCGWCASNGVCVDLDNGVTVYGSRLCPEPLDTDEKLRTPLGPRKCARVQRLGVEGELVAQIGQAGCRRLIRERVFEAKVTNEIAAMYYHWHRDLFEALVFQIFGKSGLRDRENHILLEGASPDPAFLEFVGTVSHYCPRFATELPTNTCFCEDTPQGQRQPFRSYKFHLIESLGLVPAETPPLNPPYRVGIVSRQRKRFILNEQELVERARALGWEVVILPFERMTLYEQVREVQKLNVLVGMHGSGLVNAMFLPPKATLWQVMPYKARGGETYFRPFADMANAKYREWTVQSRNDTVMHMHFLPESRRTGHAFEKYLSAGGNPQMGADFFTFWINQDTRIPPEVFEGMLTGDLYKNLHANPRPVVTPPAEGAGEEGGGGDPAGYPPLEEKKEKEASPAPRPMKIVKKGADGLREALAMGKGKFATIKPPKH